LVPSSSYAISASYAPGGVGTSLSTGSSYPITSSWALSASWAPNSETGSGTSLTTGSTYPITASWALNAPSSMGSTYNNIYVDVGACKIPSTSTAAAVSYDTGSANTSLNSDIIWFDSTVSESAQFKMIMDDSWNRGTVKAKIAWMTLSTGSQDVTWQVKIASIADSASFSASVNTAYGPMQQVVDTNTGKEFYNLTAATPAITVGGTINSSSMTFWNIMRITSSVNNLVADAGLMGVWIQYATTSSAITAW
jgi:hypothetical protein